MIKINLLPFRAARKKENVRRQISIFILTLVLASMTMAYLNIYLGGKLENLEVKLDRTKKELAENEKKAKQVDEIRRRLDILNKKMDVIADLQSNRRAPVELLEAMTDVIIKKRMWFTKFSADSSNVNISGVAFDNKTVADFMIGLESSGFFSSVDLNNLQQAKMETNNLKSFFINCILIPASERNKRQAKQS